MSEWDCSGPCEPQEPWLQKVFDDVKKENKDRIIAELRQAVGLLTTLHPTMQMDADNPLDMAQKIVSHITAENERLREQFETMRFGCALAEAQRDDETRRAETAERELADEQARFGYFETAKLQEAWAEIAALKAKLEEAERERDEAEEAIRILASRWPRYDLADGPAKLPAVVRALGRER